MTRLNRRIAREARTIEAMLHIFCRDRHGDNGLCSDCSHLLDYARRRLATCPFQDAKPACNKCQVHCYSKTMQTQVKAVMRYAGPRMLLRHPILSLYHVLDNRRLAPSSAALTHLPAAGGREDRAAGS
jgi:predicted amidophosphoribosyltransferase